MESIQELVEMVNAEADVLFSLVVGYGDNGYEAKLVDAGGAVFVDSDLKAMVGEGFSIDEAIRSMETLAAAELIRCAN
jgi:hypothetical protein